MTAPPIAPIPTAPLTPHAQLPPLLRWLVERAEVAPDALEAAIAEVPDALENDDDPVRLARALASSEPMAALMLVAAALPPREGIWWAMVAVRHALQTLTTRAAAPPEPGTKPVRAPDAKALAAIGAVERWIAEPTDANRREAWRIGQEADVTTPAGAACAAVFFTTGSLAAIQSPMDVPPPPGAHVTLAATAVLMSAIALDPAHIAELVAGSAAQGEAVAKRLGGWTAAATLAREHFETQRTQHGAALEAATPKAPPA